MNNVEDVRKVVFREAANDYGQLVRGITGFMRLCVGQLSRTCAVVGIGVLHALPSIKMVNLAYAYSDIKKRRTRTMVKALRISGTNGKLAWMKKQLGLCKLLGGSFNPPHIMRRNWNEI